MCLLQHWTYTVRRRVQQRCLIGDIPQAPNHSHANSVLIIRFLVGFTCEASSSTGFLWLFHQAFGSDNESDLQYERLPNWSLTWINPCDPWTAKSWRKDHCSGIHNPTNGLWAIAIPRLSSSFNEGECYVFDISLSHQKLGDEVATRSCLWHRNRCHRSGTKLGESGHQWWICQTFQLICKPYIQEDAYSLYTSKFAVFDSSRFLPSVYVTRLNYHGSTDTSKLRSSSKSFDLGEIESNFLLVLRTAGPWG